MPILYEDFHEEFRKRSLTKTKDTELTVTITMAAGKGVIVDAHAFDATLAKISKAYPGQPIGLYVSLKNTGDMDYLWATIKDKDTGAILVRKDGVPCSLDSGEPPLPAGATLGWTAANAQPNSCVVMPAKNLNLLIEAGHGA